MASQKQTSEAYQQYVQNLYNWKKKIKEQEKTLSKDGSLTAKVGNITSDKLINKVFFSKETVLS